MEEPVLSPEESQALMDALKEGDVRDGSPSGAVQEIDLVGGERPLRAVQPFVEKLCAPLAAALRRTLAATYRLPCDVAAEPTEIIPFGELRRRVQDGTLIGRLETAPSGAPVLLLLGAQLVSVVTDFGFGGSGEDVAPLVDREPTALERNLLRRLCMMLATDVAGTWKRQADVELNFLRIEGKADLPSVFNDATPMLIAPFQLSFNNGEDSLLLALSAGSVDGIARLAARELEPTAKPAEVRQWLKTFKGWSIEVAADLGRTSLTVREALELKPGTVIRLDSMASEPANILFNGVPKLKAQPVVANGAMGLQVERWIETEREDSDGPG